MRSLEKQLPLSAFILLTVVALALTLAAWDNVRSTARELAGARLAHVADQLSASMGPGMERTEESLSRAAADPAIVRVLARPGGADLDAATRALVEAVPEGSAEAVAAGVWDLAGDLVVRGTAFDGSGWAGPPPLVEEITTTPLVADDDTTLHYAVVAPVRDGRRLVGFVQVQRRLRRTEATDRTLVTLLGREGTLLLGSPGGVWTDLGRRADPPPPEVLGASAPLTYERGGLRRLGMSRAVPGTGFTIVTELPESVALAPTRAFLGRVGAVATLLVLLATGAAWLLGRRITRPLAELRHAARELGSGDYDRRAPEKGHPEIAEVARTFNQMAARTEGHVNAIRASEQRFRSLVTATSQIVWWTDAEGNMVEPVPAWQAFTGRSFDDTRGAGWTGALHPDDAASTLKVWKQAVANRSLFETDYRIRRHDGVYRWVVARAVPILDRKGAIREWVGTCTDVTERRDVEEKLRGKEAELQQSQRLDAVGRLAGGIAHDFNNLLTAIMGPADLAAEELPEGHPVREELHEIRSAAVRASELTGQLLAFGRQQVMNPAVLDVNEVVASTGRLLERVIGESIQLDLALSARDATVRADRTQLEQVIVNLAVNARDAMPDGGRLTIETQDVDLGREAAEQHDGFRAGRYVLVAVTDDGAGMDAETRRRIFEPFFTTKEQGKGTGLGLSTVYGIVRQSGGQILVYSEPGQGTTFKLYFPWEDAEPVATAEAAPSEEVPRGTETILMAEDEANIRRLGVRVLSRLGYTVLLAEDGEDALAVAAGHEGTIDLLLSDVVMPEINGIELWERLRMERPSLPALFLSGWASDAVVRHGILDGQVPFLQKPFSARQLGFKVREVLDAAARGGNGVTRSGVGAPAGVIRTDGDGGAAVGSGGLAGAAGPGKDGTVAPAPAPPEGAPEAPGTATPP